MDAFRQCQDSGKYAEAIHQSLAEGEKLDVRGTPSFFLGVSDGGAVKQVK